MLDIAAHRLFECARFYLVQRRQVEIQHYALAADFIDFILDNGYFIH